MLQMIKKPKDLILSWWLTVRGGDLSEDGVGGFMAELRGAADQGQRHLQQGNEAAGASWEAKERTPRCQTYPCLAGRKM